MGRGWAEEGEEVEVWGCKEGLRGWGAEGGGWGVGGRGVGARWG